MNKIKKMTVRGKILIGAGAFILFLLLVFTKVTINARNEYQKGDKFFREKDYKQAIIYFNRAIHWYSPGSKSVTNSIQALWEIGTQAEHQGDTDLALNAFQSITSSLYSARSFYTPHQEWIAKCEDQIATIRAKQEEARLPNKGIPLGKRKEAILKILRVKTEPDVFWSMIVEVGFLGWIGCAIGFILRVFIGEKGFNSKRAVFWGGFNSFFSILSGSWLC
jgi:hypothetical protein